MRLRKYIFSLLVACACQWSMGAQLQGVGVAPVVDSEAQARVAALEQAKRSIVEQAFGTFVEARTTSENFLFASDFVQSSVAGRIERYRIVEDKRESDSYTIKILATVDTAPEVTALARELAARGWSRKPSIVIDVVHDDSGMGPAYAAQVRQAMAKKFSDSGYRVVRSNSDGVPSFKLEGRVDVSEYRSEVHGVDILTQNVSFSVELFRSDALEVLAFASHNANGATAGHSRAAKRVVVDAANALFAQLTDPLTQTWLDEQARTSELSVSVEGISDPYDAENIQLLLSNQMPGIIESQVIKAQQPTAILRVTYAGWPEQFQSELSMAISAGTLPVVVRSVGVSSVSLVVKKGDPTI